jgi:hypothetical protein
MCKASLNETCSDSWRQWQQRLTKTITLKDLFNRVRPIPACSQCL